jgi:dihydroorotate dehydrogenase (NAD+) catalytic subunit
VAATVGCGRPRWAKLTAVAADLPGIAAAAVDAGAEAVTLVNTVPAMALDVERRRPVLGGHGGGLSGPAIHPVAVRAVWDVHAAHPGLPIVGVGGVMSGRDALELVLAGASAVQVGTATFAEPRAAWRIQAELGRWCAREGVDDLRGLVGAAHRATEVLA